MGFSSDKDAACDSSTEEKQTKEDAVRWKNAIAEWKKDSEKMGKEESGKERVK